MEKEIELYKYTTYLEVDSKYLLIRRIPSKLTLQPKSTRISFRNKKEAIDFLNDLKLKLQDNNYKVIDQDSLSFRVKHQSPLLMGLNVTRTMTTDKLIKTMSA